MNKIDCNGSLTKSTSQKIGKSGFTYFGFDVELALDEADRAAALSDMRYSGEEVFSRVRGRIRGRKVL